jgi:ATP-dependent Zn protease
VGYWCILQSGKGMFLVPLYFMNNLLTKHNFRQCEICAYHESGHVLSAYLCGYTCKEVQFIDEGNENGFTSFALIEYGKDSYYASKFTTAGQTTDFFNALHWEKS